MRSMEVGALLQVEKDRGADVELQMQRSPLEDAGNIKILLGIQTWRR